MRAARAISFQAIAAALNADGIAPRRGVRWRPYSDARIAGRISPAERGPAIGD